MTCRARLSVSCVCVGGGHALELLPEELLVELPETGLVCLGVVMLGVRVMLGDAGTEGDEKKER